MFETQSERYPVKIFQNYHLKCLVGKKKPGPFYLQATVNPLTNIWFKQTPMGISSINSMMKDLISNSPLRNGEKHLANYFAKNQKKKTKKKPT